MQQILTHHHTQSTEWHQRSNFGISSNVYTYMQLKISNIARYISNEDQELGCLIMQSQLGEIFHVLPSWDTLYLRYIGRPLGFNIA